MESVSNSLRPLPVRFIAGTVLLVCFLSFTWSPLLLPFVDVLPYLQRYGFLERFAIAVIYYLFTFVVAWWATTPGQRKVLAKIIGPRKAEEFPLPVALLLCAAGAAYFSANFFGSLAWVSPGQPYIEQFEIERVKFLGSKYRSVELNLVSSADQRRYSLQLSKRLFDYPRFVSGTKISLYGKETLFGVYIERFDQQAPLPTP